MPPRKEIWDELTLIWGQATPLKADQPSHNDPDRTCKIILKTAAITSIITAVAITANVITAFAFTNSTRNHAVDQPSLYHDEHSLNTVYEYLLAYQKNFQGEPIGRVASPRNGAVSGNRIKVSGYTKKIPVGHQVVLAVDAEWLRLYWPKKPYIHPNTDFRPRIIEERLEGECTVGLYAVDEEYCRNIKQWMDEGRFGGMPLIPMRYRLDGVKLFRGSG